MLPRIYLEICCYFAVQRFRPFFLANPGRLVQHIRRDYKSAVLCPFPWCEDELQFKLANIFTRLQIVSKTRERSKLTDEVVNMTDVFRPHAECENPRVVLVEGNPAMGKTTYCRKLAHDWSLSQIPEDGWFPKVEMLLLLKCRDINVGTANIQEAIDDQLLPEDVGRSEKENFFHFISAYQSRILLVLDGLDELKHEELFQGLLPLIQGKVLSNIYILLSARIEMGAKVRRYCHSLFQIVGYSNDDVNSYIDQYFRNHSDPSLARKLKEKLAHEYLLKELTTSPMNTALLCLLCEETNGIFPTKQTELYECLVSCAIRRYCAKRGVELGDDNPSERYRNQLNQLGKMAFEALWKNRLYFSGEERNSGDFLQLCFVTREPSRSKMKPTPCYAFTHKTFQEYFAALYLANQVLADSREGEEMLLKVSSVDNRQVWNFLFPLVAKKDDEKALFLVSCFVASSRLAIREPKNDITETTWFKSPQELFPNTSFWVKELDRPDVDIVARAVYHIGELEDFHGVLNDCQRKMAVKLAKCIPLDECEMWNLTTRELLTFSEYLRFSCTLQTLFLGVRFDYSNLGMKALAQSLQTNCVLTHLCVDYAQHNEDEIAVALSEALESNSTLTHLCFTYHDERISVIGPSGASALARALTKNSTLKCLDLGSHSIGNSGAQAFADALQTNSTLTHLDLGANYIGHFGTEAIFKALQFNHVMTHLVLSTSTISDSGAEALAAALQSPSTQLSHLDLAQCNITPLAVQTLAGAFQTNRSLTHLSLARSSISCSATALAEALQLNRTLNHLDLSENDTDALGTEVICKALQSNHVMTHLILGGNTIGDSGAGALAEALQSPATRFSYLHLDGCHISSRGLLILAGALQTNRSLTHLNLGHLGIRYSATAIAEALQVNRTLTHLNLTHNNISDTEAIQLAQTILDKNNTLACLDLFRNNIGFEARAKLKLVHGKRCVIGL